MQEVEVYANNPSDNLIESITKQTIKSVFVKQKSKKSKYCYIASDDSVLMDNCIESLIAYLEKWTETYKQPVSGIYSDYYLNKTRQCNESFCQERLIKGRLSKANILMVDGARSSDIVLHLPEPLYTIYARN